LRRNLLILWCKGEATCKHLDLDAEICGIDCGGMNQAIEALLLRGDVLC
jgi:hypothetical protein